MKTYSKPKQTKVPLFRNSKSVNNLFSALGDLRETTLTACLGYLISEYPESFGSLFVPKGHSIQRVIVEHHDNDTDRYDVVIVCDKSSVTLEAKLGFRQQSKQVDRYLNNLKKKSGLQLLDQGSHDACTWVRTLKGPKPITWADACAHLEKTIRTKAAQRNEAAWGVAQEFIKYLEANRMSNSMDREIYVRDMSGDSISLLFQHKIYKCQPKFYSSAVGNRYFAPYFTTKAPGDFSQVSMIRIEKGISWIFPIKKIELVKNSEVIPLLRKDGRSNPKEIAKKILRGHSRLHKEVLIFFLEDPFMAFMTPISKTKLGLTGAMGSRNFTFRTLFSAAGRGE